jgi:hypothetical protein
MCAFQVMEFTQEEYRGPGHRLRESLARVCITAAEGANEEIDEQ